MPLTDEEKKRLKVFEKKLGYSFKKKNLLKRALTHKSYTNESNFSPLDNNERSEFLGDAVLELTVSHLLMERFPNHPEGELSKLRAAVVNETELAELARLIDLGEFLYLGRGELRSGGKLKPSILSDALEAVLGAIYLDRGFSRAFKVVEKHYSKICDRVGEEGFAKDYKTKLQEAVQARFRVTPQYKLMQEIGPDHKKIFKVHLYIQEELYGVGEGPSKKSAEQESAREALKRLP